MTSNSFGARDRLTVGDATYEIVRLNRVAGSARLPFSLKVLLENLLRNEDGRLVTAAQIEALAGWDPAARAVGGDPVHPGPGAAAGLHRGAVHRGPGRDAGGDGRARRRPGPDQPAAPGRADHRPLGDRRLLRPARTRWSATSSWSTGATAERYAVPALGPAGVRAGCGWCRRAPGSATRSTSSTWPGWCSPRTAPRSPTPWSAPTRTPRWSTASACSAGAWAASRPRRRCSASR